MILNRGVHLCVCRKINKLKAANFSTRLYISFLLEGDFIFKFARTLVVLVSIHRL